MRIWEPMNTIFKRVFQIGDKVKIRVIEANKLLRKINFELVQEEEVLEEIEE